MNREITSHKVNGLNETLIIEAMDEPGSGGANHKYAVRSNLPLPEIGEEPTMRPYALIRFQNGPIGEAGVNGISNEALLAIIIDRLQGFQSGPFKCRENAIALTHLEDAMHWLQHRTRARVARGVEGTNKI